MLIIVEGKTDRQFIESYCKYLGLQQDCKDIFITESKDNINVVARDIKKAIKQHKRIAIIFDSDKSYEKSLENIKKQLRDLQFKKLQIEDLPEDFKIEDYCDIFLFPKNEDLGDTKTNNELETLIKMIAKHSKIFECFESYEKCIQQYINDNKLCMPDKKSKIYAYKECFKSAETNLDKISWNDEMIDFNHKDLEPLKEFLLKK